MQFVQKIMAAQFALPALFFGADALSETGLENWMRLTIDGAMPRPPDLDDPSSRSTAILKAISNQRRLQILNHLSDGTERSVSEIEQLVPDLSQSALSQHLGRLRQAEIVKTRRVSQTIFYSIEDQNVVRILRPLKQIYIEDPALHLRKN